MPAMPDAVNNSLAEKLVSRRAGICLYGFAPPKQATPSEQLKAIVAQQLVRLGRLPVDGLIVYDIQDEAERVSALRPFPFLPTLNPEVYAHGFLGSLPVPKIVYRCVNRDTSDGFVRWLERDNAAPRISVLVGAPSRRSHIGLPLTDAYALAQQHSSNLLLGGIAIAERHARTLDEHKRILAKTEKGCRFFVTQAVYDVTSTKSLLSDYALAVAEKGDAPLPVIARDPLAKSLELCERIFAEVRDYARDKGIPLGVNVESVSIRKEEIEASVELLQLLRRRIDR